MANWTYDGKWGVVDIWSVETVFVIFILNIATKGKNILSTSQRHAPADTLGTQFAQKLSLLLYLIVQVEYFVTRRQFSNYKCLKVWKDSFHFGCLVHLLYKHNPPISHYQSKPQ